MPLDDGVLESVGRFLAVHPASSDGLIFTTLEGRALDLNKVYGSQGRLRWFRKAARAAGRSDEITLHDLRHFYASLLIRNGANVKLVQARARPLQCYRDAGHLRSPVAGRRRADPQHAERSADRRSEGRQ